jgi:hypothetical protein
LRSFLSGTANVNVYIGLKSLFAREFRVTIAGGKRQRYC